MKMTVYTTKALQDFASILSQAINSNEDSVKKLRSDVRDEIKKRHYALKADKCPDCEIPLREPCIKNQVEGLKRLGCPKCTYSKVI